MTGSFRRLVGRPLCADQGDPARLARWLYREAPFCLLAHDGQDDPCFVYANRTAQACFGYDWDAFVGLPSRLSAEAPDRAARRRLLDAVRSRGYVDDYSGVRIAKSGRRFRIEAATVWDLLDAEGIRRGQAATFPTWSDLGV